MLAACRAKNQLYRESQRESGRVGSSLRGISCSRLPCTPSWRRCTGFSCSNICAKPVFSHRTHSLSADSCAKARLSPRQESSCTASMRDQGWQGPLLLHNKGLHARSAGRLGDLLNRSKIGRAPFARSEWSIVDTRDSGPRARLPHRRSGPRCRSGSTLRTKLPPTTNALASPPR